MDRTTTRSSVEKAPSGSQGTHDIEKQSVDATGQPRTTVMELEALNDGVPRNHGIFRTLWSWAQKLDRFGVEARGIERVPPEDRPQSNVWDCFTMWCAANTTISTFSLGTLGASLFELGFRDAVLTIIFFNLLSTIPVAYFSTFGARTGLRQMVFSRFAFGYWFCMFPGVLNVIATIGWSTINSIVGGQTLQAVSHDSSLSPIPVWGGILVIAVMTILPPFAGYKFVHTYERWSWIAPAIIFFIMLGEGRKYMQTGDWGGSGPVEAAGVLSFGASIVGFGIGWVSYAADYTVNLPETTSGWKIFCATYAGLNIPLILVETLGAAFMTTLDNQPHWGELYDQYGIGGLIAAGVSPAGGFGRFLTVLMGLSIVANNIPNIYSLSLTIQIFGPQLQAIPRVFITVIGTAVYIVLAIVGATHFEEWLDTLLVLLSYWLVIYAAIVVEEHLIFRQGSWKSYTLDEVNNWRILPIGVAAFFALGCGVMGAVLGMAQTWYIGVLGGRIGDPAFGGDIGFELSFAFSAIAYPPLRYIEKKIVGR